MFPTIALVDLAHALVTGLGLSGSAGLNAYIPVLTVGVLGRLGVIDLGSPWGALESTPLLIVLAVLLAVEVVADKVPAVDSANDVVQTVLRPAAGALLFAGSVGELTDLPALLGAGAGLVTAGGVHAAKAAMRPAVNVSTAGTGAPVVSVVEDVVSLVGSLLALLAPVLLAIVLVAFVAVLVRVWRRPRAGRSPT